MEIKPIPLELLIHEAEVKDQGETDMWGNTSPGKDITLEHVRFEPSSAIKKSSLGKSIDYKSLLFIDTVNSKPAGFEPKKEMEIAFNGDSMFVESVDPVYALDPMTPHHYEVYLT